MGNGNNIVMSGECAISKATILRRSKVQLLSEWI